MPNMTPEELRPKPTDGEQLKIKLELQLLKGEDDQYVLSSLASIYALPKLIEYIQERDQQRLSKIKEVFDEFEQSGPPWASRSAKIQYEGFRDYFLPALTAALGPDNSKIEETV